MPLHTSSRSSLPPHRRAPRLTSALVAAAALFAGAGSLQAQMAAAPSHLEYVLVQSGTFANPTPVEGVVWSDFVTVPQGTPWLRLYFSNVFLDQGSYLRMVSLRDGEVMTMRQEHLAQWGNSSAFFNGNAVLVELVAGPHTQGNKVEIDRVLAGDIDPSVVPETICGATDDRVPSADARAGRLSIGCTGWIINADAGPNDKLHLSAGHCFGTGQVLSFGVPASGSNCALVQPPVAKQFAVDSASSQSVNGGIGNDYWVYKCFPNSTTGRTTFQEQGAAFVLATSMPAVGATLRNTGYGLDGTNTNGASTTGSCSCSSGGGTGSRNQTQQTHTGALTANSGTTIRHQIDTCGGNSGSPIIHEATGQAIGIHTHGGCSNPLGTTSNSGTQVTHPGLVAAIASMSPTLAAHLPYGTACGTARSFYETFASNTLDLAGRTVRATRNGSGGYDVSTVAITTFHAPNTTGLALGDDVVSAAITVPFTFQFPGGSTTTLRIDSNGRVHLGATGASNTTPTVGGLLGATVPLLAIAWADLLPDGATNTRNVFVHSPVAGELDITWNNVPYFGATGAITCQIALIDNGTNDRIELRYSAVSTPNLTSLVGFSTGGGAVDPGTRDLTAGSFSTSATDLPGLSLTASPTPLLGSTVTYTVGNVRANASLSQILVNFNSSVPTPLSTIGINAPGCLLHIPAAGSVAFSPLLLVNPTATFQFTLPVGASWAGVSLYLQALELAPAANPGGVISSNGLQTRMNTF